MKMQFVNSIISHMIIVDMESLVSFFILWVFLPPLLNEIFVLFMTSMIIKCPSICIFLIHLQRKLNLIVKGGRKGKL